MPAVQKVFVLRRGDEVCGVILYKYPGLACQGRREAFGRVLTIQQLNRDLTTIAGLVVHPKYPPLLVEESIPDVEKLFANFLDTQGTPYIRFSQEYEDFSKFCGT